MDVGQKGFGPLPRRCFYWKNGGLTWGGVWFFFFFFLKVGEYEAVGVLSLWLSKLRVCRGWLAGRPRNRWACRVRAGGRDSVLLRSQISHCCCVFLIFCIPESIQKSMQSHSWRLSSDSSKNRWLFSGPLLLCVGLMWLSFWIGWKTQQAATD